MTCAHGAAIFASVNSALPSHATLLQFAVQTGLKLANRPAGPWTAVLDTAASYLAEAGLTPPAARPRPTGRTAVLRFSVPVAPIDADGGAPQAFTRDHAIETLRAWDREQTRPTRPQRQFQAWQRGKPYANLAKLHALARSPSSRRKLSASTRPARLRVSRWPDLAQAQAG